MTAEDCIASLERWGARDSTGVKLMSFVAGFKAVDQRTFELVLKEPYGLVLDSLGKPGGSTPLIMPRRIAETDPGKQIEEFAGSGPFIFKKDEWKPGERAVYVRNSDYKPRPEPPSGLAGGKVAKVDRVEWLAIPDPQSRKLIAFELQERALQYGTHIHLGQYTLPTATRADRLSGMVTSPIPVFWNSEKK